MQIIGWVLFQGTSDIGPERRPVTHDGARRPVRAWGRPDQTAL